MTDLAALLSPRSVAVVGASRSPMKIGHTIFANLQRAAFPVYPINPRSNNIQGHQCYPDLSSLPEIVDLAIIATPARYALEPAKEAVELGVGALIVIAGGFNEAGPVGTQRQVELQAILKGSKTRALGPNTLGVFVPHLGLDTMFTDPVRSPRPPAGEIAFISQSGAVGESFMNYAADNQIGLRAFAGLGNKVDLNEVDLMEHFAHDPGTRTLLLYLEDFEDGRHFIKVCQDASGHMPVLVLKGGRTDRGARAAASHTGALATSGKLAEGALRQARAVPVYDEQQMMDAAFALTYAPPMQGSRVGILTSAGGYGVISTDLVDSNPHLCIADLSQKTVHTIKELLPFAGAANPIDLTGSATDAMFDTAIELLMVDEGVDGILAFIQFQMPLVTNRLFNITVDHFSKGTKPMVVCSIGGGMTAKYLARLRQAKIPAYPAIHRAVGSLAALALRGEYLSEATK